METKQKNNTVAEFVLGIRWSSPMGDDDTLP